jgi:hypothetical protein
MSNDDDDVQATTVYTLTQPHSDAEKTEDIDLAKWRDTICQSIAAALDNEHLHRLAVQAQRLALLSPKQTVLKFALWLEVEEPSQEPAEDCIKSPPGESAKYKH